MSKVLRRRMVDELVKKHDKQKNFVLVSTAGMTSNQAVELRRDLREAKAKLTILKNSVAHHAFEKMGLKDLQKHLTGMTGLVTGSDPVVLAKKLTAFKEKTEKAAVRGAQVEGKSLTAADVTAMSKLPGREQLLSTLLGTMQAPAQQFVNVLHESVRQLLGVLAAYETKLKETKA
jgi:large subunit ribosomal protein L10